MTLHDGENPSGATRVWKGDHLQTLGGNFSIDYALGLFRNCPVSVNFFAHNSGAGNGCANFLGAWNFCVLFCRKTSMPIEFLVLGGAGILGFFWGGECRFYFYGRGDCSELLALNFRHTFLAPFLSGDPLRHRQTHPSRLSLCLSNIVPSNRGFWSKN